jgi:protein disulfide-isomerase
MSVKRHLVLLVSLLLLGARGAFAAENSWETDFDKAQSEAKSQHKLLFINFTGSDWCGYCIRMDRDVLSKQQFKDFASKNLVLLEVDFPRMKEQTQSLRTQNRKLAGEYGIEGFPTFVVLDSGGKRVWAWGGYYPGGPDAFVAELEKLPKS